MPVPVGVITDFQEPAWVSVDIAGEPVRFLLKPLTLDDYLTLLGKHGICLRCVGSGVDTAGQQCKNCGGAYRIPEMVPEFRLDLLRLVVRGWEGLTATGANGERIEVSFSDTALAGLARLISVAFEPIRAAAQNLGAQIDEKKGV